MQTAIDFKYLNFVKFQNFDKWYVSYYINPHSLLSNFQFVNLGRLIVPEKQKIKKNDYQKDIRVVKKISFADGNIHLRDENETNMDLYIVNYNDLLVSKINFHQGALAINKIGRLVSTTHYQPYSINRDLVLDEYLILTLRSKKFQEYLSFLRAEGIKNEATYEFISELQIPLPTLSEQETIINDYQTKIQEAQELEQQAKDLEGEIEKYFLIKLGLKKNKQPSIKKAGLDFIEFSELAKWSIDHFNKRSKGIDISKTNFKTLPIKNLLLFFEGGKTPSKSRKDFWSGDVFWTSPKDFTNKTILDTAIDTISKTALKEAGVKLFPKGTLLSVFRSGILRHSFPTVITEIETTINQDLKAYSLKEELIDKFYYLYFVNVFKEYVLLNASKKSVTVESINTEDFLELRIVLPPLEVQRDIVVHIESVNFEIKNLNRVSENLKQQAHEEFEQAIFS